MEVSNNTKINICKLYIGVCIHIHHDETHSYYWNSTFSLCWCSFIGVFLNQVWLMCCQRRVFQVILSRDKKILLSILVLMPHMESLLAVDMKIM